MAWKGYAFNWGLGKKAMDRAHKQLDEHIKRMKEKTSPLPPEEAGAQFTDYGDWARQRHGGGKDGGGKE